VNITGPNSCTCDLCKSRQVDCQPLEIYFAGKIEETLVRIRPGLPIYVYEMYGESVRRLPELESWAMKDILFYGGN
jgi:hypothetical protein